MQRWREEATILGALAIGVNLSAQQFRRVDTVHAILQVLGETRVSSARLELEITEHVLIEDLQATARTVQALKSLGARLAIDDFGTGYSSLSYLRQLAADTLKI